MAAQIKLHSSAKRLTAKALIYIALSFCAFIVLLPIAWMVTVSVKPHLEMFSFPPRWFPKQFTLSNYLKIIQDRGALAVFLNSYTIAGGVTLLSSVIAAFAGYGISRFSFPGKHILIILILVSQMVPGALMIIPYFLIITKTGLYNTRIAIIISDSSLVVPFCIMLFASFFDSIPFELEEAAMIDGCSRIGTLYKIVMPLSGPAFLSTGIFAFILGWNEFMFALTLTESSKMWTVTVKIASLVGQFTSQWDLMMAFSVVAIFPLVILAIFFHKHLMRGLLGTALK